MEIEKTRETSWKIQLKKNKENIELTSVEISGEVRLIKLSLIKDDTSVVIEMNKEEFFNFLSLISAFKDVVIGEDLISLEEDLINFDEQENEDLVEENADIYPIEPKSSEKIIENNESEELNPEEWDPW